MHVAVTGLIANQKALDVVSHNITNANTPGYSRQITEMASVSRNIGNQWIVQIGLEGFGAGVNILDVVQVRDAVLDAQYREENAVLGEWKQEMTTLGTIETLFNEPSETGLNSMFDKFFTSLRCFRPLQTARRQGVRCVRMRLV